MKNSETSSKIQIPANTSFLAKIGSALTLFIFFSSFFFRICSSFNKKKNSNTSLPFHQLTS